MSGSPMSRMTTSMPSRRVGDLSAGLAVGGDLDDVAVLLEQPREDRRGGRRPRRGGSSSANWVLGGSRRFATGCVDRARTGVKEFPAVDRGEEEKTADPDRDRRRA